MTRKERQKRILEILEDHGAVSVKKLTQILFASEATVRRELTELERIGAVKRTFGGAMPMPEVNRQIPLLVRQSLNSVEKNEICRRAASLVQNGQVIFLDGSSTAQHMVKHLRHFSDLVVITNGLKVAELLSELPIKTFCTGGRLIENSLVFTGRQAEKMAEEVNVDICFLSCKGLSEDGVFSDTSEEETDLRRKFLACSKTRVMLMTANKIGKTYLHTLCRAEEIDCIFSGAALPPALQTRTTAKRSEADSDMHL